MKYLALIYSDARLLDALATDEADAMMSECRTYERELRRSGHLLDAMKLESGSTSLRMRNGRLSTTDGPFAETKEQLGGFGLLEAKDLNEAIRVASGFPWVRTGSVEIRPLRESPAHVIGSAS